MSELVVMSKEGGQMNVPPAKVQEYLDAGWTEIARVVMTSDDPAPVSSEVAPKAEKPKGKTKD